jgi:hypothetical protein
MARLIWFLDRADDAAIRERDTMTFIGTTSRIATTVRRSLVLCLALAPTTAPGSRSGCSSRTAVRSSGSRWRRPTRRAP